VGDFKMETSVVSDEILGMSNAKDRSTAVVQGNASGHWQGGEEAQ